MKLYLEEKWVNQNFSWIKLTDSLKPILSEEKKMTLQKKHQL